MAEPRRYDFRVEPNDCLPVRSMSRAPQFSPDTAQNYVAGSLSVLMTAPIFGVNVASLSGNFSLTLPGSLTALIEGGNASLQIHFSRALRLLRRTLLHGYVVDATK
jgi:hypothetical protein